MEELDALGLPEVEVGLALADPFQPELVGLLIALGSRSPDGRPFPGVQHPKLEPGQVRCQAHFSTEGVNFPCQMALAQPADGRIAGHLADGIGVDGQQEGLATHARRRKRRLNAGMARTQDDNIILFREDELHSGLEGYACAMRYWALNREGPAVLRTPRSGFAERCSQILKMASASSLSPSAEAI